MLAHNGSAGTHAPQLRPGRPQPVDVARSRPEIDVAEGVERRRGPYADPCGAMVLRRRGRPVDANGVAMAIEHGQLAAMIPEDDVAVRRGRRGGGGVAVLRVGPQPSPIGRARVLAAVV